jgi:hypothetical protein
MRIAIAMGKHDELGECIISFIHKATASTIKCCIRQRRGGGQKKTIAPDYLSIINAILNPQS